MACGWRQDRPTVHGIDLEYNRATNPIDGRLEVIWPAEFHLICLRQIRGSWMAYLDTAIWWHDRPRSVTAEGLGHNPESAIDNATEKLWALVEEQLALPAPEPPKARPSLTVSLEDLNL